jgi:CubicO group peptidase (beta-lactamase class C family)
VHLRAFGRLTYDAGAAAVAPDTIWDLASLTKVVVTTTLAMMLVDEGKLDLEARVSGFLPGFTGGGKERVTLRQLLTHSGGLLWWAPLYKDVQGGAAYLERILATDLAYEPGTKAVYSDLGLILLGDVIERLGGAPLGELARLRVLDPLGMKDTLYLPPAALLPRIAPTENDPWRGRVLRGEVHDENAFALGGIAPHAGLFGTAPDLARFAAMLLDEGRGPGGRLVSRATVELFTARAGVPLASRALGWDTPANETGERSSTPGAKGYTSAGSLLSPRSFGHTGFTGTSMWMDPERELFVILLTNRVHPTRENDIRAVRAQVADAAVRALERP